METQIISKYLKLPFQFDPEKLAKELHTLLKSEWVPHFNTNGYGGQRNDWSDDLFFSLAPKESLITIPQQNYYPVTIKRMVGELGKIQTSGTKQLILELGDQLDRT